MRRICEFLFISALVVCIAGCSGLSDVKGSGGSQVTGVTVSPLTATVDPFVKQQQTQTEPIELGTSGGIINDANGNYCCSGTLGALVTRSGTQYILSNNHVLANSAGNSGSPDVGVGITQPGLIEVKCASSSTHTVANLSEYFPLE